MKDMTKIVMTGSALLLAAVQFSHAQTVVWDDDFSGASLNGNLSISTAGAGASVTQSGGQLLLDTEVTPNSARALVFTQKDSSGGTTFNGNPLYNFYDHEVSIAVDIASIAGTPGNPTGRNAFFVSIGQDASDYLVPNGNNSMDYGQGIMIEQLNSGSGAFWRMIGDSLNNNTGTRVFNYTLSGAPTAVTYTFDGTAVSISMTGATFTTGTFSGTSAANETFNDLSGVAAFNSYSLAIGAINLATGVVDPTLVTLNSFEVTVIPEPSAFALLAGSLTALVVLRRRRR